MSQTYEDKPTLAAWNALGGFQLIKEAVLEEDGVWLELSLADVNWSEYAVVCLIFSGVYNNDYPGGDAVATISFLTATQATIYSKTAGKRAQSQVWFTPMYRDDTPMVCQYIGFNSDGLYATGVLPSVIGTVHINVAVGMAAGSYIRLYGIR